MCPAALSAAFAASRTAAMLASVICGGVAAAAGGGTFVVSAGATVVSPLGSPFEHPAHNAHATSTIGPRDKRIDIVPPNGLLRTVSFRTGRRDIGKFYTGAPANGCLAHAV